MALSCRRLDTSCRSFNASNSASSFVLSSRILFEAPSTLSSMSSTFCTLARVLSLHSSIAFSISASLTFCFSISSMWAFMSLVGSMALSSSTWALSSSNLKAAVVCFRFISLLICSIAVSWRLFATSWRSFIESNSCSSISFVLITLSPISVTLRSMSSKWSSWTLASSRLSVTSPTTISVTEFSISCTVDSRLSILESILFTSLNESCQMAFSFRMAFILACTSSFTMLSSSFTLAPVA
mmetsp:Transcript_11350/g.31598  ORF Transcript_11350/g.31598 Transcript_11350/m.31598 type:complete len:240 (-) Transcript_11350:804-1523(-)